MSPSLDTARAVEHRKYVRAYTSPRYRMKKERMADAVQDLASLPCRGSYLDVACGQGDMLTQARALGFAPVQGTEIVPSLIDGATVVYGEVHALPFPHESFDVVTLFDVIEHLLVGDDERACKELKRIARRHILLTANNQPSHNQQGDQLHINCRPYEEWDALFAHWFDGRAHRIQGTRHYISEAWRIDL